MPNFPPLPSGVGKEFLGAYFLDRRTGSASHLESTLRSSFPGKAKQALGLSRKAAGRGRWSPRGSQTHVGWWLQGETEGQKTADAGKWRTIIYRLTILWMHYTYCYQSPTVFFQVQLCLRSQVPACWSEVCDQTDHKFQGQHGSLWHTWAVKRVTVAGEGSTTVKISQRFRKRSPSSFAFFAPLTSSCVSWEAWGALYSLRFRLQSALSNSRKKKDTIRKLGQSNNVMTLRGGSWSAIASAGEIPRGLSASTCWGALVFCFSTWT